jgi:hypothetical protein
MWLARAGRSGRFALFDLFTLKHLRRDQNLHRASPLSRHESQRVDTNHASYTHRHCNRLAGETPGERILTLGTLRLELRAGPRKWADQRDSFVRTRPAVCTS